MRYSIMLQLVATISVIFLGTAALFAWLQYRPTPEKIGKVALSSLYPRRSIASNH